MCFKNDNDSVFIAFQWPVIAERAILPAKLKCLFVTRSIDGIISQMEKNKGLVGGFLGNRIIAIGNGNKMRNVVILTKQKSL